MMINKILYIIDRPLIGIPVAIAIGMAAGILDSTIKAITEAIAWSQL